MLYLTRKIGDTIVINGNIFLEVLEIKGTKSVKIGFSSPSDTSILRGEVYERIKHENQEAQRNKDSLMDILFSNHS